MAICTANYIRETFNEIPFIFLLNQKSINQQGYTREDGITDRLYHRDEARLHLHFKPKIMCNVRPSLKHHHIFCFAIAKCVKVISFCFTCMVFVDDENCAENSVFTRKMIINVSMSEVNCEGHVPWGRPVYVMF